MSAWFEKKVVDIEVICEIPARVWGYKWGTPEYWNALDKELKSEAKDFEEFIRDSRSQDSIHMTTRRKYEIHCIHCGYTYKTEEPDGLYPSCCEAAMKAEGVQEAE